MERKLNNKTKKREGGTVDTKQESLTKERESDVFKKRSNAQRNRSKGEGCNTADFIFEPPFSSLLYQRRHLFFKFTVPKTIFTF